MEQCRQNTPIGKTSGILSRCAGQTANLLLTAPQLQLMFWMLDGLNLLHLRPQQPVHMALV